MTDTVLIIGGGVAGATVALECANAGARAVIIDRSPVVGGRLAALMAEESDSDRVGDETVPTLDQLHQNERIEIFTLAGVDGIDGRPGNFSVSFTQTARLVTDACTRCNLCRPACPVVVANEFDSGLTYRKAIYTPLPKTLPAEYVIDIASCLNEPPNYLPCNRCSDVCDDNAISFEMPLKAQHQRQVAALVVAAGLEIEDELELTELGYGHHPDIVTTAELQRLLESPGPSGGYAIRPSNEEYPDSVLLVINELSGFGLYVVASQAHQLLAQDVKNVEVLVPTQPQSRGQDQSMGRLSSEAGITLHWGAMFRATGEKGGQVEASWEDFEEKHLVRRSYDLVVLCSDVGPPAGLDALGELLGAELAEDGFLKDGADADGIYLAGCVSGPKNIQDSMADARKAAAKALADVNPRLLDPAYLERRGADVPGIGSDGQPDTAEPDSAAEQTPQQAPGLAEDEVRRRIEQMLYGLLQTP